MYQMGVVFYMTTPKILKRISDKNFDTFVKAIRECPQRATEAREKSKGANPDHQKIMKVRPWFSMERPDVPSQELFHHDNPSCLEGAGIHKNHHRYGTDNRPLCKKCARLNAAGR
jgi:hypothetical protein